jgi:starch synthase (maltosyl-transferring)
MPVTVRPPSDRLVRRVIIDDVQPSIDGGRFPIKRTPGEWVRVTAVIFADGHDVLAGVLKYRALRSPDREAQFQPDQDLGDRGVRLSPDQDLGDRGVRLSPDQDLGDRGVRLQPDQTWQTVALENEGNDRWSARFQVTSLGVWEYTIEAWIDRFASWLRGLTAKFDAGQDVASELLEGAGIIQEALHASSGPHHSPETGEDDLRLLEAADFLRSGATQVARVLAARESSLAMLMRARGHGADAEAFEPPLRVTVDARAARFSAWYEMFPRSCTQDPARSGTFRDAERRLADIAAMGFDVLYLPPIHPIGTTHRKGRNNALVAGPDDPGSPWAIGSAAGGHTAVHPELGTLADFDRFVSMANRLGVEVALDIAFQASPDHPWVREHPSWFRHRPDGSIKYAENPPKKYQDIFPLDFESRDWRELWAALRDVFLFWVGHGVRIFRVDNPHTKSFRFWEWCIAQVQHQHPDTVFLAEAFTRPAIMRYLAKVGFSQSYTYFTWRNTAHELRSYLTELTTTDLQEFMRPNFFANTPDILHEYLQQGGRAAFEVRVVLAATLSASYGIYSGFELCEHLPVRPGSEEYLDSEKYQIRVRDWNARGHIKEVIRHLNVIRHRHPALQRNDTLHFHETDNPELLAYSKTDGSGDDVFVVVNTDPWHVQHGWVRTTGDRPASGRPYTVHDLLDDARYTWRGEWNYVRLDPAERVAHVFVTG